MMQRKKIKGSYSYSLSPISVVNKTSNDSISFIYFLNYTCCETDVISAIA